MLMVIKFYCSFFWVFFCMVEAREFPFTRFLCLSHFLNKFLRIEGEFSSSIKVGHSWIRKIIKLMSVVVIAVHWDNQRLQLMNVFKLFFQILAESGFA